MKRKLTDLEFIEHRINDTHKKIIYERAKAELAAMEFLLNETQQAKFHNDCKKFLNRIARNYIS